MLPARLALVGVRSPRWCSQAVLILTVEQSFVGASLTRSSACAAARVERTRAARRFSDAPNGRAHDGYEVQRRTATP